MFGESNRALLGKTVGEARCPPARLGSLHQVSGDHLGAGENGKQGFTVQGRSKVSSFLADQAVGRPYVDWGGSWSSET